MVGVEVEGDVTVETAAGPRRLRFRADRLDRVAGQARLTDYKSGAPYSTAADAGKRRDALVAAVGRAKALQGAAYAFSGEAAEGRYLFARPGVEAERAVYTLSSADADARASFAEAVRVLLEAWDLGLFPPRLLGPDRRSEPSTCGWCEVSEACLRGESGARRRLRRWLEEPLSRGAPVAERGARALHELAERPR